MVKLLYGIGVLALTCAGVPFSLCGIQWWQETSRDGNGRRDSIVERAQSLSGVAPDKTRDIAPPLVVQATAFALYLNPPKPPPQPEASQPRVAAPQPAHRPVVTSPKFRLLSTSRHHSYPEESLALISEPGKGDRWIRQGDRLGHLSVESIADGRLVYRDGDQLYEVSVAMKQPVELARLASVRPASTQDIPSGVRLVNASRTSEPGIRAPDGPPANYDQD